MPRITFDQLLPIYRNTAFAADGMVGRLRIADESILETLKLIDTDDRAFEDAGITLRGRSEELISGATIEVEITPPRSGLGMLARNMDELLAAPENRLVEPSHHYVVAEHFAYNDTIIPDAVARYRLMLRFVAAFCQAAALVDPYQAEATFLDPGRLRIPILYRAIDLPLVIPAVVDELEEFVSERIHRDQKMAILASNAIELSRYQPENERFRFLLAHMRELLSKTRDGYRLFASEFSYEKIRTKTEEAINDYTGKIHKTFYDIQNQVMGVPVATVVVATQLKAAAACGVEFWANLAVSVGATLFVLLLSVAIYNQLMTLNAIQGDLERQQRKFVTTYADVAGQFLPLYNGLGKRIVTHRWILRIILTGCWIGVGFTWFIFSRLTAVHPWLCFA